MDDCYKKLNILWSFDNPGAFRYIISKTAMNAIKREGCERVQITLFGGAIRLAAEQARVREGLKELMAAGVIVVASQDDVEAQKLRDKIEAIEGIEIKKLPKRAVDGTSGPDEKLFFL